MEYQQNNLQDKKSLKNIDTQGITDYSKFLILGFLALLAFLLYWPTSIELSCTRSFESSLECSLTRYTPLLRNGSAKISDPLAVDIVTHFYDGDISYTTEIRSAHSSYAYPIMTTIKYELARKVENEINHFLLDSDDVVFFRKYK